MRPSVYEALHLREALGSTEEIGLRIEVRIDRYLCATSVFRSLKTVSMGSCVLRRYFTESSSDAGQSLPAILQRACAKALILCLNPTIGRFGPHSLLENHTGHGRVVASRGRISSLHSHLPIGGCLRQECESQNVQYTTLDGPDYRERTYRSRATKVKLDATIPHGMSRRCASDQRRRKADVQSKL